MADSFELSTDQRGVFYDCNNVLFTATLNSDSAAEDNPAFYENAGFFLGEKAALVCVVEDITANNRTSRDILSSVVRNASKSAEIPLKAQFCLLWQVRFLKYLLTQDGRRLFLECLYRAVHTLLCCHPDGTLLSQFFQDKPDFVKGFLSLLRTGPGSVGYIPGLVPVYLRQLACQCLSAILGSRDSSNVSVLGGKFSWLQHDLGVNR